MPFSVEASALSQFLQQLPRAESLQGRHTVSTAPFLVCSCSRNLPEQPQRLIVDPLPGSGESARQTVRPQPILEQMDYQQQDPDQEEDPGSLADTALLSI